MQVYLDSVPFNIANGYTEENYYLPNWQFSFIINVTWFERWAKMFMKESRKEFKVGRQNSWYFKNIDEVIFSLAIKYNLQVTSCQFLSILMFMDWKKLSINSMLFRFNFKFQLHPWIYTYLKNLKFVFITAIINVKKIRIIMFVSVIVMPVSIIVDVNLSIRITFNFIMQHCG